MNGRLIRERRATAGLTVRQLADQPGVDPRTVADLERSSRHDARAVTVGLPAKRSIWSLGDRLPTTAPLEPADDRKVAAALIEHGVLTRDDLAAAVPSHWIWSGLTSIGMPPRGGRRVPAVWVAATRPLGRRPASGHAMFGSSAVPAREPVDTSLTADLADSSANDQDRLARQPPVRAFWSRWPDDRQRSQKEAVHRQNLWRCIGLLVLVTGGTGYVGSHAIAALAAAGHRIRVLARAPKSIPAALEPLGVDGVEAAIGDVTEPAAVERALEGCDAVLHAASVFSMDARKADAINSVNVRGTDIVLGTAHRLGLDPIVYVSSEVALLPPADGEVLTPDSPVKRPTGPYCRSKADAELVARKYQASGAPV